MGIKEEINEIEAVDFCYACYYSEANHGKRNLQDLGFLPPIDYMKCGPKTPDLVYLKPINGKKELFALLIDTKSGHIQEDHLEDQAKVYAKKVDGLAIQDSLKTYGRRNPIIDKYASYKVINFSVAFQYYAHILDGANQEKKKILDELAKLITILSCKKGDCVRFWKGIKIKDADTASYFDSGIEVPTDALRNGRLSESPSEELVAITIADHAMACRSRYKNPILTARQLQNDVFRGRVRMGRIETVMSNMNELGICVKKRPQSDDPPPSSEQEYEFCDIGLLITELINPLMDGNDTLKNLVSLKKSKTDIK